MRRLRLLRFVLLAFLGAFALWILADIWRTAAPTPEPPEPPPASAGPEAFPVAGPVEEEAEGFQIVQQRGDMVVSRLQAGRMLGVEGGSRVLSDILIEVRPDPDNAPERLVRVEGEAGRFDSAAHEIQLSGAIHLALDTGEWLQTEGLSYRLDERLAAAAGPVRFDLAGSGGTATGMVADLSTGRVELLADVVLEEAGGGGQAARIRAERLRRDPVVTLLAGAVRIEGDWGAFEGNDLEFTRTDDLGTVGTSLHPGSLTSRDPASEEGFVLSGGRWLFRLDADRRLRSVTATGAPRLSLVGQADGAVRLEDLRAPEIVVQLPATADGEPRLVARGVGGVPTLSRFSGGSLEQVRADRLVISRRDGGAREALFTGGVRASGESRQATGAALRVAEDRTIELSGLDAVKARVIEDEQVLEAEIIRFRPDGGGEAEGDVEMDRPGNERMAARGHRGAFGPGGRFVRLEGDVRVWQGDRTLSAGWVESDRDARTLRAGENVRITVPPGESGLVGLRASERVTVRADNLLWEELPRRRASFAGEVRMSQEGAEIEAERLVLEQMAGETQLLVAEGQVRFRDPQWRGSGDRLVYQDPPGKYELESYTDLARVASGDQTGDLTGRLLRFERGGGAVEVVSRDGGRATVRYGGVPAPSDEPRREP